MQGPIEEVVRLLRIGVDTEDKDTMADTTGDRQYQDKDGSYVLPNE